MNHEGSEFHFSSHNEFNVYSRHTNRFLATYERLALSLMVATFAIVCISGCVSDKPREHDFVSSYQRILSDRGPQQRGDTEGHDPSNPLGLIRPVSSDKALPQIEVIRDPNTGKRTARLTIDQAVARTLVNSTEIKVVSFDPSIAKYEITKAAAQFDPAAFGRVNYDRGDAPINSIFEPGQSDNRAVESGIKQKMVTGSEWSLSYALTRRWDDLFGRTLATRYEPIIAFQLRQPLLRDAWAPANLAGLDIAKLEHRISLLAFRQKVEDVSTAVVTAYWRLYQTRNDFEVQQQLFEKTLETLKKVEGRKGIDATDVHIKQTESYVKVRNAMLIQAEKRIRDAQDVLLQLMADTEVHISSQVEVIPVTVPHAAAEELEHQVILEQALVQAMMSNPAIQHARIVIEIADINIRVAENQKMPRLDLVASVKGQGIGKDRFEAHDVLDSGDYVSSGVGLSLEYPLGNRDRHAELLKRQLERRKAISTLQNTADQVAIQVKERSRKVETNLAEIGVQKQAVEAAKANLQALEDTEAIREKLTPEFLLVKLQAQEALAQAQRAQTSAIVEFNIALAELAQATGTVLELQEVKALLPSASSLSDGQ